MFSFLGCHDNILFWLPPTALAFIIHLLCKWSQNILSQRSVLDMLLFLFCLFPPKVISPSPMALDTTNDLTVPKFMSWGLVLFLQLYSQHLQSHSQISFSGLNYSSLLIAQTRDLGVICGSPFFLFSFSIPVPVNPQKPHFPLIPTPLSTLGSPAITI